LVFPDAARNIDPRAGQTWLGQIWLSLMVLRPALYRTAANHDFKQRSWIGESFDVVNAAPAGRRSETPT